MLSCRRVKGPLIFVSVLMHRETNLQVENEETIEAQSARTPKRCWTESNSAFSFACTIFLRWCSGRRRVCTIAPAPCVSRGSRASPPFLSFPASRSPLARSHAHAVRAYPVGVRKWRPLHSAFADRAVGKIGRQFSYKQNAEEGVRLDEKRRAKDRGRRGGWCRSFGVGCAWVSRGVREPSSGRYARFGAICRGGCFASRCVRIRIVIRVRIGMNGRLSQLEPPARVAESVRASLPSADRCIRIDRISRNGAFLCLLHSDDIAVAHRVAVERPFRRAMRRARMWCRPGAVAAVAFHGKTSVGVVRRDS
ncbi:hypothetical protein GEM_0083 [Burkholderia cepacia GG4]|uniref:Uncharacterized protein n=1 Tax=Burkholderia cepacia GG4 TaxID=1009846 RepID=A0A9W3JW26_BURCE|nr:hypothetical protein GEM_0083 [Burkholderia cepacia GG4]